MNGRVEPTEVANGDHLEASTLSGTDTMTIAEKVSIRLMPQLHLSPETGSGYARYQPMSSRDDAVSSTPVALSDRGAASVGSGVGV